MLTYRGLLAVRQISTQYTRTFTLIINLSLIYSLIYSMLSLPNTHTAYFFYRIQTANYTTCIFRKNMYNHIIQSNMNITWTSTMANPTCRAECQVKRARKSSSTGSPNRMSDASFSHGGRGGDPASIKSITRTFICISGSEPFPLRLPSQLWSVLRYPLQKKYK